MVCLRTLQTIRNNITNSRVVVRDKAFLVIVRSSPFRGVIRRAVVQANFDQVKLWSGELWAEGKGQGQV